MNSSLQQVFFFLNFDMAVAQIAADVVKALKSSLNKTIVILINTAILQ